MGVRVQKPDRKITSASVSAAAATVVVYVAGLLGLDMAPEVAAAFVSVATAVAGYFTPNRR